MDHFDLLLRLTAAAGAGVILGLERELRGHPAGMRTHTLVATGAAMFTIAGAYGFAEFARSDNVDPARVAAQVASGIGFIGAGAILRDGMDVRGITTAATLWLSAALGVGAGAALYTEIAFGTALVLLVLTALRMVKPLLQRFAVSAVVLDVQYEPGRGILGGLIESLNVLDARIQHLKVYDSEDDRVTTAGTEDPARIRHARLPVAVRDPSRLYRLIEELGEHPGVHSVRLEPRGD